MQLVVLEALAALGPGWWNRPTLVSEMIERADAIVEGRVESIEAGPRIALDAPETEGGHVLQTQRITLRVADTLKGDLRPLLVIVRIEPSTVAGGVLSLAGDPPYHRGDEYLVFASRWRGPDGVPDGTFLPVGPDGRLRLSPMDASLEPLIDGPVAEALRGKTKSAVRRAIEEPHR